jgi:hypothetical protein
MPAFSAPGQIDLLNLVDDLQRCFHRMLCIDTRLGARAAHGIDGTDHDVLAGREGRW